MAITPHLVVAGGKKAVEFYAKAFGAEEVYRMPAEDGERLMHAHLKVGDAELFLCDDFPEYCAGKSKDPHKLGGTGVTLHQYVPDADAAIARAAAAGATVTMPAQDMFWGDRYGQVVDPFGHTWSFAHKLAK
jgi:PhnB protein